MQGNVNLACNIYTACSQSIFLSFFRKHKFTFKKIFWEISVKLNGTAIDILNNYDLVTLYGWDCFLYYIAL